MKIDITGAELSTQLVIAVLILAILVSIRKASYREVLPVPVSQELKGVGMLAIVFAHIAYMLVSDNTFLYPLTISAGVGVDIFLFMSGFGLTTGMLKKQMTIVDFFQRRLIKVFIPFWVALVILFVADAFVRDIHYSLAYMLRSAMGYFPTAYPYEDVNSPFWYITWMLLFYFLFPFLFMVKKPWLSAVLIAVIANAIAYTNPLGMQANWLHQLHTNAFSLGMLAAWLLAVPKDGVNTFVTRFTAFRDGEGNRLAYGIIVIALLAVAGYVACHITPADWPVVRDFLKSLQLNPGPVIGQVTSLITMFALIGVFCLKKIDLRFFYLFGFYSYEVYLLHWPLMGRYDIFYRYLPASLATVLYLVLFIVLGWLLQKITTPIGNWFDGRAKSR